MEGLAAAELEVWTRRSIARGHIESSIQLIFQNAPRSTVNLLAAAAVDVLRGVLKSVGKVSTADEILAGVPPDIRPHLLKVFKAPYNFSKHADNDADQDFAIFLRFSEFVIFLAITDYRKLYEQWTFRMLVFTYWFYANHKDWLVNYQNGVIVHKPGWFEADKSAKRAAEILEHFGQNPKLVDNIIADLDVNWIERP